MVQKHVAFAPGNKWGLAPFIPKITELPLSAMPNAGIPSEVEGRNIYLCSPEYMAEHAKRFILNGVKIVGGCLGV